MTERNNFGKKAEKDVVTAVLSRAMSKSVLADPEDEPSPIYPSSIDRMSKTVALLQQVEWEFVQGLHGPQTLKKQIDHQETRCPECDTICRYDENGDVVCDDDACAVVVSDGGGNKLDYINYDASGYDKTTNSRSVDSMMRAPGN